MSILTVERLGMYYGAQDVFSGVSFDIARGDKVALVGPNGGGKTTLFRIILGLEESTSGQVHRARSVRIAYLPQRPTFESQQTLYDEMLAVFSDLRRRQKALLDLAEQLAAADDPSELMSRYAEVEQRFDLDGGYTYENRIARVLSGLGFNKSQYHWPIAKLSGGQVTRALLARLLLEEPEMLLLDEPTNHLDLSALEWFESYLQDWKHSLLIVSHDRYFLDKVVSRVLYLHDGTLDVYRGNYTHFVEQRAARLERQRREYEKQQEQIAVTEDFVRRYKAGQRSKEARGRQTRLNRMERIEAPQAARHMRLRLTTSLRAGDKVLETDGVVIGYRSRPDAPESGTHAPFSLLSTGPILVERGQRIVIMGPNGSGKTTFLRTILGQVEPLSGRLRTGASLRVGYLPQTQDWLDPEKTVLEQMLDMKDMQIAEARGVLGRFLFSGDAVKKKIASLSGGERARLALASLTLKGANLLLLDEPTTHLDVESQEILQDVLSSFDGTILLVSHDRYLADALATHLWVVAEGRIMQYEGNYSDYVAGLTDKSLSDQNDAGKESGSHPQRDHRRERRERNAQRKREEEAQTLEREIADLEREMATMSLRIDQASHAQDLSRVHALGREYERMEERLADRLRAWEAAASNVLTQET